MLIIAQVLKEEWFKNHGFCSFAYNKQTCEWLPTIPLGLAGKNVKNRPLSEPIRLQDLENFAASLTKKKINVVIYGTSDVSEVKITRAISYG